MTNPVQIAICELFDEGTTGHTEISRKLEGIPGTSPNRVGEVLYFSGRATAEQRKGIITPRNLRIKAACDAKDWDTLDNLGVSRKNANVVARMISGLLGPVQPLPNQRGKATPVPKGQIKTILAQRVDWPPEGMSCWACGESNSAVSYEVDHIIPLSKGGDDTLENSQILCRKHNQRKGNLEIPLWDFRKAIQSDGEMVEGYTLYNLPPVGLLYGLRDGAIATKFDQLRQVQEKRESDLFCSCEHCGLLMRPGDVLFTTAADGCRKVCDPCYRQWKGSQAERMA